MVHIIKKKVVALHDIVSVRMRVNAPAGWRSRDRFGSVYNEYIIRSTQRFIFFNLPKMA